MKKLILLICIFLFSCKKEQAEKQPEIKISNYTFEAKSEAAYSLRYTTDLINFKDTNVTGNFVYKFTGKQKRFPDNKYQLGFSKSTIAPIEIKITMDGESVHSYFTLYHQYTISY